MNHELNRDHARVFEAQAETLAHLRGVLDRIDIPYDEVDQVSGDDAVCVVSPLEQWNGDRVGRRIVRIARAYAAASNHVAWTPSACRIEVPIRSPDRVATARVEHKWLPEGRPVDATDEEGEELMDRIRSTMEVEHGSR